MRYARAGTADRRVDRPSYRSVMRLPLAAVIAFAPVVAAAQRAPASPRDTTRASVGAANVHVEYSRPSKRGRVIFAENGLVPRS